MRTSCSATTNERLPRRQPSPAAAGNERSHGYGYERPYWRNWRADRCPCGGNGVGGGVPCAILGRIAEPDRGDAAAFEAYIDEKRETEDWLRAALAVEWAPEHDFEVARDENDRIYYVREHIYPGCVLPRLPSDFASHTHNDARAEKWAYATSVKPVSPRRRVSDQFVLLNGVVYVLSARISFDFLRCSPARRPTRRKRGFGGWMTHNLNKGVASLFFRRKRGQARCIDEIADFSPRKVLSVSAWVLKC